ncbi:class I SAM-dependent methyltransferase [Antrihabitans sp. YC3-6]|uniref:Class I SAM-dependent methyltransferase n=1 Tax=Antrihabitans stalagmiti TaxID=2799499 RepID=A0A934U6P6_9NOCA|nr:class I SAM-dependent methyltransferase [Antrihabitans stalagmiti]MBJ8342677.1 class I SAM-dependent methyltransferase [Antrihabitans stalagmiti]
MDNDRVGRSYSAIADTYIRLFGEIGATDPDDLEFIERHLGTCAGVVLDAGCGPGHLTGFLADLGRDVRGIDLVPEFIDNARSNRPDVTFDVCSMLDLDVPDRSLGGILAWYSLIHCAPDELATPLNHFRKLLSDSGTLVVGFFHGDAVEPFAHKVTTAYRWPIDEMSKALAAAGFDEIERVQRPGTDPARTHAALAARAN